MGEAAEGVVEKLLNALSKTRGHSIKKISVLMAVLNTPHSFLKEAIASILGQTYSGFEFIILDDGSHNASEIEHVVKGFRDERITFLRNEQNRGIAASYNQLIAVAQGEYLAIMNHDDVALSERLEKQLAFMEVHPEVGICGTGFKRFGRFLKRRTIVYPQGDAEIRGLMLFKCPIHHPSAMIRKSVLLENGICYDQHYLSVNDRKLFFDIAATSKCHNLPDVLMNYRLHRGMASRQIAHVLKREQQAFRDCYFKRLGVIFNAGELYVIDEYLTRGRTPIYNVIVLKQMEAILLRLIAANGRTGFAGQEGFNKILKRYFLKRCLTAAVYGRISSRELIKYSPLMINKNERPFLLWLVNRFLRPQDLGISLIEKDSAVTRREDQLLTRVIPKLGSQPNKGVIYTCITAGYDVLVQHTYSDLNWDYICFSDDSELLAQKNIGCWQVRPLTFSEMDPVRNARWHKTHPHILVSAYDYSVWLDANINVRSDLFFKKAQQCIDEQRILSAPEHFYRDCIYDEAVAVKAGRLDFPEVVDKQVASLKAEDYPSNNGLNETGLLFRRHNDQQCRNMMDAWWEWIRDYSRRDQLSFNYIVWKANYQMVNFLSKPGILQNPGNFERIFAPTHNGQVRPA